MVNLFHLVCIGASAVKVSHLHVDPSPTERFTATNDHSRLRKPRSDTRAMHTCPVPRFLQKGSLTSTRKPFQIITLPHARLWSQSRASVKKKSIKKTSQELVVKKQCLRDPIQATDARVLPLSHQVCESERQPLISLSSKTYP